jgi:hypothetical protein
MSASLVDMPAEHELGAGKSTSWSFKIGSPNEVWAVNAVPVPSGDTQSGFNEQASVEVTKVWRTMTVKQVPPHQQDAQIEVEHHVNYEVKNIGTEAAKFIICLSKVA